MDDEILHSFGQQIKVQRLKLSLSQEQLAHICDLDRTYISSIERGKRNVSLINIFKLADALNVPPAHLLDFVVEVGDE